jgi:hypothetical protein
MADERRLGTSGGLAAQKPTEAANKRRMRAKKLRG